MAIKTEASISTSSTGICMPRILILPSPVSLGIAAEMEQEENGHLGLESYSKGAPFAVNFWKRGNKFIYIKQRNCPYPSKYKLIITDSEVTENQSNKMSQLKKSLGIIETPISLWKELRLSGKGLHVLKEIYFFQYVKHYDVKKYNKGICFDLHDSRG